MPTRSTLPREHLSAGTRQPTATRLDPPRQAAARHAGAATALLRPYALYRLARPRLPLRRHRHPELAQHAPDRVDATLLPEDEPALGADEIGGVRLDRGRVVDLRGDRTRLAREEVVAGDRLPGGERRAGELLHERAQRSRVLQPKPRRD